MDAWPQWHQDLEFCKMQGPFAVGEHFLLKPKGAGAVKIFLTQIEAGTAFTDCTHFFGAKMYDSHRIEATPEGLRLSNTLWVTGPLAWLWVKLVAQKVAATVPDDMEALVARVRGLNAH